MASSSFDREAIVYLAQLANVAGRHYEMAGAMKILAIQVGELTATEKVLLGEGYRKVVGPLRSSWKKLSRMLKEEVSRMLKEESNATKTNGIIQYLNKLENEIYNISVDIVSVIDGILIPYSKDRDPDGAAFYYRIKGDFISYIAEISTGDQRKNAVNMCSNAYEAAIDVINRAKLPATSPTRLGVALNFSIFYCEILGLRDRAIKIAKKALEEASSGLELELDRSNEKERESRDKIMQHLKNTITAWTEAGNKDGDNIPPST